MYRKILPIAIGLAAGIALAASDSRSQNRPPCWEVPNGSNRTIACANGYWITTTPDGLTYTGNGTFDPNDSAQGSTMNIDPTTGGPVTNANRGPTVSPPQSTLPYLAPHQAEQYGQYPPLE